jgi:hypothetical protein
MMEHARSNKEERNRNREREHKNTERHPETRIVKS